MTKKVLLLCLLLCGVRCLTAQWSLAAAPEDPAAAYLKRGRYADAPACRLAAANLYSRVLSEGWLDARLDTSWRSDTLWVRLTPGTRYFWTGGETEKPRADPSFVPGYCREQLRQLENSGFPFASAGVRQIRLSEGLFSVDFDIQPGPLVQWDSLGVKAAGPVPMRYIRNYIGFRKGGNYAENWLVQLPKKLREIPFVRTLRNPEVMFHSRGATLYLYLEKKKANFFNGVLGLQPNESTGKINLTGDAELRLVNSLNAGEDFYLNWRKLQPETQDLQVRAALPYVGNFPVGAEGNLKIYRRDSTFSSVKSALALIHMLTGQSQVRAFVERNRTNALSSLASQSSLANVNATWYGLALVLEKFDYRFNPLSGQALRLEAAAGNKEIQPRAGSENLSPSSQGTYRVESQLEKFLPTFARQTVRVAVSGAAMWADSLFENEAWRLGGWRTIRGFDDESLNATSWAVGSVEYRLLPEENTCFYLFADLGWYEYRGNDRFVTDTPLGFGAGANFETRAGIFTFNYALGRQFDNPILLRNAKVSFGFRSLF